MSLPLKISADLTLSLAAERVKLTPAQALRAAETLIRQGTRAMMLEEALAPPAPPRRRRAPASARPQ
jgi:hypothetical protein